MVPIFTKQIVSSTYRFQNVIYLTKLGRSEFSSSIIKMSCKTGPSGEPMAFCVIDVAISFRSHIHFKTMSIVWSSETFVNKDLASNDTFLCFFGNFSCVSSSMNSLVFFTVFLGCRKSDSLERYFAKLYVAMFRFETVGRIGSSLIPPFTGNLCTLPVP